MAAIYRMFGKKGELRPVEIKQQLEHELRLRIPFSRISDGLRRLMELGFITKFGEVYRAADPVLSTYAAMWKK